MLDSAHPNAPFKNLLIYHAINAAAKYAEFFFEPDELEDDDPSNDNTPEGAPEDKSNEQMQHPPQNNLPVQLNLRNNRRGTAASRQGRSRALPKLTFVPLSAAEWADPLEGLTSPTSTAEESVAKYLAAPAAPS